MLLGTLEARLSRKVQRTATKLGASKPEADRLGEAAKFDPTSKDLVCNSVGLVCRKHAVSGEYAPEISLLIGVGDIGFHFMGVLEELDELEKRAEARSQGTEVKANPSEAAP